MLIFEFFDRIEVGGNEIFHLLTKKAVGNYDSEGEGVGEGTTTWRWWREGVTTCCRSG